MFEADETVLWTLDPHQDHYPIPSQALTPKSRNPVSGIQDVRGAGGLMGNFA